MEISKETGNERQRDEMSDSRRVLSGSIALYSSNIFVIIIGFFTSVILVRNVSEADYGVYNVFVSIFALGSYITSLGLQNVIIRFVPEYLSQKKYNIVFMLISGSLMLRAVMSILFVSGLIIFKNALLIHFKLPILISSIYMMICFTFLLIAMKRIIGTNFLNAFMRQMMDTGTIVVTNIIRIVLLLLFFRMGYGLYGVFLSWFISEFAAFSIYAVNAITILAGLKKKKHEDSGGELEITPIVRYGLFDYFGSWTWFLRDLTIDTFIIAYYLDMKQVGLYAFAIKIIVLSRIFNPTEILKGVIIPMVASRYRESEAKEDLKFLFKFLTKLTLFLIVPAYFGIAFLAEKLIIHVFDPKFVASIPILFMLLGFLFFRRITSAFGIILVILKKNEYFFYTGIFGVYNILLELVLVPRTGIMGAAFASGSTVLLMYLFYWLVFIYILKIRISFPFTAALKIALNTAAMLIALYFMEPHINSVISLMAATLVAAVVYFMVSAVNRPFVDEERKLLNKSIGRPLWIF